MDFYRADGRASFLSHEESESVLEDTPAVEIAADLRLDRKRAVERLLAALGELPDAQREAFLLQQEGELSIEEIAAATGVSRENREEPPALCCGEAARKPGEGIMIEQRDEELSRIYRGRGGARALRSGSTTISSRPRNASPDWRDGRRNRIRAPLGRAGPRSLQPYW